MKSLLTQIDTARRTKIVCTIGPSSNNRETIRALLAAGMNVARLNFSHGTHETHRRDFETLREVAAEMGHSLAIMMDLQGPKIRTGPLAGGSPVALERGQPFCLTTRAIPGGREGVSTTYNALPRDVGPGDRILLADGAMELRVEEVDGNDVRCVVVRGGYLGEHKGINLPGVNVSAPSLTDKDLADLEFGLELGIDFVALSFVRRPEDVQELRRRVGHTDEGPRIVAKIERPEAIECIQDIIAETDVVMVARGDLGVEVELARVPQLQKRIIRACNDAGIPVITATQMLESMINSPRPTRAEAADVANAVYDGADAVMLSAETALGQFPVEAVETMARIVRNADEACASDPPRDILLRMRESAVRPDAFGEAMGQAVCRMSHVLHARRVVCFSKSGTTARSIARYRPRVPITVITATEAARRRCALYWGAEAVTSVHVDNTEEMLETVERILVDSGLAVKGDVIIIAAGRSLGAGGMKNLLTLHEINGG